MSWDFFFLAIYVLVLSLDNKINKPSMHGINKYIENGSLCFNIFGGFKCQRRVSFINTQ